MVGQLWHWLKTIPFLKQRALDIDSFGRPVKHGVTYSCYYVTIHFASTEDAARFTNKLDKVDRFAKSAARIQRGGEMLRMCKP